MDAEQRSQLASDDLSWMVLQADYCRDPLGALNSALSVLGASPPGSFAGFSKASTPI
jgi:hypothetical protein